MVKGWSYGVCGCEKYKCQPFLCEEDGSWPKFRSFLSEVMVSVVKDEWKLDVDYGEGGFVAGVDLTHWSFVFGSMGWAEGLLLDGRKSYIFHESFYFYAFFLFYFFGVVLILEKKNICMYGLVASYFDEQWVEKYHE